MEYSLASSLSFAIRAIICYYTIETTPIFANTTTGWIFGQIISIYTILRIVAYFIVGNVFEYKRGSDPTLGVLLYGFVHVVLILALWGILALLTLLKILPIR